MATESLIIELDAKTKKLDAALDKTDKKLKNLDGTTTKADSKFKKFTATAKVAAVAVTAAAVAIGAAARQAVIFARELEVAANRAGVSVERMQALAFATNTVGVSMEKLGDIYKDTNEKVGEFLATGGGGFQDFADVIGLTTSEARAAAKEFENMSGEQVLQEMVARMDAANISAEQMSFALEGMASDTTDLIPLLKDGAQELNSLTKEFDDLNITLSQTDLDKIGEVGLALDKSSAILKGEGMQAIADYSSVIVGVVEGTTWLLAKTSDLFSFIGTGWSNTVDLTKAAIAELTGDVGAYDEAVEAARANSKASLEELFGLGNGDSSDDEEVKEKKIEDAYEEPRERTKAEEEYVISLLKMSEEIKEQAIARRYEEIELHKAMLDEKLINEEEYHRRVEASIKKSKVDEHKSNIEFGKKKFKAMVKLDTVTGKAAMGAVDAVAAHSEKAAKVQFEVKKALNIGEAIMGTAEGITEALPNYPLAIATGITGAAQIATIASQTFGGGGSVSAPSGGSASTEAPQQQREEPETSDLSLSSRDGDTGTSQEMVIHFATDSGDELLDALAGGLNDRQRRGG